MPPGVALTAWCCPCVALGNLAALRGESCFKWAIFFMLPPLNCICHYKLRREISGATGGCFKDAMVVSCCPCAAIVQETKSVRRG
ncbi:Oidioi.mRNA.OKI2018_I69.chr2.g6782.t1.cds [Oikopleura dioica]|uniref:Oidioi.mRNA.OKI2018_I69.chr2.g6782.t1.cds n=1 Tax=Oikopleura dioica TaxID=34765 RepID=A0ABN7TDC6_OIKDI|nr:Oidioi.mRNA.OKI2018_I69.chr2.g6782.t1.cds [Oikopleura dioica]